VQGHITKFHESIGFGVISSDDGRRYRFRKSDIRNPGHHLVGLDVDFVVEARRPTDIIVLHGSPWAVFGRAAPAVKRS
jgi:cold shock CspA family protein